MTEKNNLHPDINRDNHLSDFTDSILENQAPNRSDDQAVQELEDIVLVMKKHTPADPPDEVRLKIKENAQAAYADRFLRQDKSGAGSGLFNWFNSSKGYQSQRQRRRVMAVQISFAAVVIIAAIALFLPASGIPGGFSGAATGELGFWLPVSVLLVAGFIAAWMWLKKE